MSKRRAAEPHPPHSTTPATPRILILGDWLVDEYWLLGEQRSANSRRRGERHTLALHDLSTSIRSLGCAGAVATLLARFGKQDDSAVSALDDPALPQHGPHSQATVVTSPAFELIGLGAWHDDDTDAIKQLIDPTNHFEQSHHRLSFPDPSRRKDGRPYEPLSNVTLHNLRNKNPEGHSPATTRIVRLYDRSGTELQLAQRIDWELEATTWVLPEETDAGFQALNETLSKAAVTHVIVADHGRGVVNHDTIEAVSKRFPDALWYVFSKSYQPSWLAALRKLLLKRDALCNMQLLFLNPTAAEEAIGHDPDWTSSTWITQQNVPTRDALKFMEDATKQYPSADIVVAPKGMSVIATLMDHGTAISHKPVADSHEPLRKALFNAKHVLPERGELLPASTVLFPLYCAHLIAFGRGQRQTWLENSLTFTAHWIQKEGRRFVSNGFLPKGDQICQASPSVVYYCDGFECRSLARTLLLKPIQDYEMDRWSDAFNVTKRGIISAGYTDGRKVFDLWRGTTDIDRYVACVRKKRKLIQKLVQITRDFVKRPDRRHTSVYIADTPGSGKSYLVERLARETHIRKLEFNITQLLDKSDLLHCFDTIVTTQAQSPGDALLVFFDEINALLDTRHVYDSFLAPLEQGIYVRSGNQFHIQPCLWVFAGTDSPALSTDAPNHDRSEKASDFLSRLSNKPFDLSGRDAAGKPGPEDLEMARLEKIYIAVANLKSAFPDATEVSEALFELFSRIPEATGPRQIRTYFREFRDVQRGRVTMKNLPTNWLEYVDWRGASPGRSDTEKLKAKLEEMDGRFVTLHVDAASSFD